MPVALGSRTMQVFLPSNRLVRRRLPVSIILPGAGMTAQSKVESPPNNLLGGRQHSLDLALSLDIRSQIHHSTCLILASYFLKP